MQDGKQSRVVPTRWIKSVVEHLDKSAFNNLSDLDMNSDMKVSVCMHASQPTDPVGRQLRYQEKPKDIR